MSGIILLCIGIAPQFYTLNNSPNPFTTISSFCKSRSYLNQVNAMLCRWFLVMGCIDRSTSCSTNDRIRRFSSPNIARRVVCILTSVWVIFPIHILIFNEIQSPGNISCSIQNNSVALYHRLYTILMGGLFPVGTSLGCSLHIWWYLQSRRRRNRLRIVLHFRRDRKKQIRDEQISSMLLIQVLMFTISSIPFMSFNFYETITRTMINKSPDRKSIEVFIKTLTELLIYLITLSFYTNTLTSRVFRKEFLKLFISCEYQRRVRRILPQPHPFQE